MGVGEHELFDVGFQRVACAVLALPQLEIRHDWAPQLRILQRVKLLPWWRV